MKTLTRLEEIALFVLSIFLFGKLGIRWWLFPALLLLPDIGMIGYAVNTKVGAVLYNLVHHRAISVILFIIGTVTGMTFMALAGLILFAHSTLDRIFGYGFKYSDAFRHTHLD